MQALTDIAAIAADLAATAAAQDAAHGDAAEAEAELLAAVVEAVRPALPALVSRVQASRCEDLQTWFPWRGLKVYADDGLGPVTDLCLREDGAFVALRDGAESTTGAWSRMAEAVDAAEVVARGYRLADIVGAVADAMSRQMAGGREKATAKARNRAGKIRAITTLLRQK